jgi:mono/diheme cytochrome c family protein
LGNKIVDDCIRCHMPLAKNADMQGAGADLLSVEMVDHYIRVVKEEL